MAATDTKRTTSKKRRSQSWQDIDQSVKPKSMSKAAERKVWRSRGKRLALVAFCAAVVLGALQVYRISESGPDLLTRAGEQLPLREVRIETNGSIDERWVLEYLAIEQDENLLNLDIEAIRSKLEAIGQVERAEVERRFPDALAIRIYEREPILRLLAAKQNGGTLQLYVDRHGHVFESNFVDPSLAGSLPFLKGVSLKREGDGFSEIEGLNPVAKLLDEARTVSPHLYKGWRVVSMEKAPNILVTGKVFKEALFAGESDYRNALAKLDYILDYFRANYSNPIAFVDLTLGNQVPVRSATAAN